MGWGLSGSPSAAPCCWAAPPAPLQAGSELGCVDGGLRASSTQRQHGTDVGRPVVLLGCGLWRMTAETRGEAKERGGDAWVKGGCGEHPACCVLVPHGKAQMLKGSRAVLHHVLDVLPVHEFPSMSV